MRKTMGNIVLTGIFNNKWPFISDILGHADKESTAVYLKVNIKKLKESALDLREEQ